MHHLKKFFRLVINLTQSERGLFHHTGAHKTLDTKRNETVLENETALENGAFLICLGVLSDVN